MRKIIIHNQEYWIEDKVADIIIKLKNLLESAIPSTIGGYPDLFVPDGYEKYNTYSDCWEAFEEDVNKLIIQFHITNGST